MQWFHMFLAVLGHNPPVVASGIFETGCTERRDADRLVRVFLTRPLLLLSLFSLEGVWLEVEEGRAKEEDCIHCNRLVAHDTNQIPRHIT